ncbi:hypothetical protein [Azospira restricta]|uniref:Uncharacterized protein n=1 Tax=Azospira restricta TaxID=404405 RepID=A0A974SR06_9RHOO|nr:hypothetical protein [Azospira restricta]QRJ64837.1 hypothetical protein IWH25_05685 [Azospira restricta]
MKTRLVCLPPGQLAPGMQVAAPIVSAQGSVLLATGAVLDEEAPENLRRRGIEFVTVSVADARDAATIAREQAAAAARIDHIFRGDGGAARDALRQAIHAYRARQLA